MAQPWPDNRSDVAKTGATNPAQITSADPMVITHTGPFAGAKISAPAKMPHSQAALAKAK